MSDDLIARLHAAAARKWPNAEVARHSLFAEAAVAIARLQAERDAAHRDGMRAAASILDAEHDKRSHIDNHAAYYARMIRDAISGVAQQG